MRLDEKKRSSFLVVVESSKKCADRVTHSHTLTVKENEMRKYARVTGTTI